MFDRTVEQTAKTDDDEREAEEENSSFSAAELVCVLCAAHACAHPLSMAAPAQSGMLPVTGSDEKVRETAGSACCRVNTTSSVSCCPQSTHHRIIPPRQPRGEGAEGSTGAPLRPRSVPLQLGLSLDAPSGAVTHTAAASSSTTTDTATATHTPWRHFNPIPPATPEGAKPSAPNPSTPGTTIAPPSIGTPTAASTAFVDTWLPQQSVQVKVPRQLARFLPGSSASVPH